MKKEATVARGGPFRLVKYFIGSGLLVIAIITALLSVFLYARSVDTVLRGAENYARLLAENLNYNIYNGFYAPLKSRGLTMDLRKWDQFGALDSLIKDFTYGLKMKRIKIVDRNRKIAYSTDYDLIGKYEERPSPFDKAVNGQEQTVITHEKTPQTLWQGKWLARTYHPLREVTGNYWMLGNIYGVIEITQDVTDQYVTVQRSIVVIILVAVALMAFMFVMLTLIVRRGESILLEQGKERIRLTEKLEQSEKLAAVGQMVATIAHEIRNPLGIVRSSAEMLARKDNPQPARVKKLAGVIVEETTRLSAILTDFLDFARPRSPFLRNIHVGDVISRVRQNLEQEIRTRGITWLEDESANGAVVSGDTDLLYQAFLNLAMNAFEAMDEGGTLFISAAPDGDRVKIDVSDDGHGIKEEHLSKIFTPFFTTHEMGTGLGLSVVHNLISAHGGEITVHSEERKGTVFSIYLPAGDTGVPVGREPTVEALGESSLLEYGGK